MIDIGTKGPGARTQLLEQFRKLGMQRWDYVDTYKGSVLFRRRKFYYRQ